MPKETSEEVAKLAGEYLHFYPADLVADFGHACATGFSDKPKEYLKKLCEDIRTLAASCLSQAEPDADDND